mmetsp:Transcript_1214/g.4504  ORF Transcript_1214/g.4504 Transcript_1214/m.4504 type:complete len:217 (-) Transcript_1214:352-1002(-)
MYPSYAHFSVVAIAERFSASETKLYASLTSTSPFFRSLSSTIRCGDNRVILSVGKSENFSFFSCAGSMRSCFVSPSSLLTPFCSCSSCSSCSSSSSSTLSSSAATLLFFSLVKIAEEEEEEKDEKCEDADADADEAADDVAVRDKILVVLYTLPRKATAVKTNAKSKTSLFLRLLFFCKSCPALFLRKRCIFPPKYLFSSSSSSSFSSSSSLASSR